MLNEKRKTFRFFFSVEAINRINKNEFDWCLAHTYIHTHNFYVCFYTENFFIRLIQRYLTLLWGEREREKNMPQYRNDKIGKIF